MHSSKACSVLVGLLVAVAEAAIDREAVVRAHNVKRNASSSTPLQVGNGNFAFGVDVTGLQSFSEFNTLSSWGFHNASLPTSPGQSKISGKFSFAFHSNVSESHKED